MCSGHRNVVNVVDVYANTMALPERQGQCKFGKVSKISKMHPSLSGEQFKVNFGNIVHNVANFLKNSSE